MVLLCESVQTKVSKITAKPTLKEHFHYGVALRCFAAIASALQRCNTLCSALSR